MTQLNSKRGNMGARVTDASATILARSAPGDITVVNSTFPMPKALARSFAASGRLTSYVTAFTDVSGNYARWAERVPVAGSALSTEFGRRRPPQGIPAQSITNAATGEQLTHALVSRSPWSRRPRMKVLQDHLTVRTAQQLGRRVSEQSTPSTVLYGTFGTILEALETPAWQDSLSLLDYPICHHATLEHILKEERLRDPGFAPPVDDILYSDRLRQRLDRELELVDYVFAGSGFVARSLSDQGVAAEKIRTIPYGIDTSLFSPGEFIARSDGPFRVLFVGQIGQRKGVRYLLDACAMFPKDALRLQLVGQMSLPASALAPYANRFEHISYVSQPTLAEIYRNASVFVFPSLAEGLPLVVLEAMASGLPVIVTPCGADEAVRDGIDGYVVPFNDAHAVANRIELLMTDDDLRYRMGQSARERALGFTIERYVAQTTTLIDDLMISKCASISMSGQMTKHSFLPEWNTRPDQDTK